MATLDLGNFQRYRGTRRFILKALCRRALGVSISLRLLRRTFGRPHTWQLSRLAYFKSDGPMMEIEMWRSWRQCISPKCQMSHLYPNGPSTECPRSVTTVTYAYRVVGILRDDKQRRNRCYQKSNSKSFSLGKSRLELRTKSQSV